MVQSFKQVQPEKAEANDLSPREMDVLRLLARGCAYKEIADSLGIGMGTVNTHIHRIYQKLHVQSRSMAVARLWPEFASLKST